MNEQDIKYQNAKARVTALKDFYGHLSVYAIVNLGLFLLNIATTPESLWFIWPLMGWGIAVVLHAIAVLGGVLGSDWEERKIKEIMEDN